MHKNQLTSLQQIILRTPSEQHMLRLITKDPNIFSETFISEIDETPEIVSSEAFSNMSKAVLVYKHLLERRMITAHGAISRLTFKGMVYRIWFHPITAWLGVLLILVLITLFGNPRFHLI